MNIPSTQTNRSRQNTLGASPPPAKEPDAGTYQIKAGDTLSGIAKQLGIPMDKLLAANPGIKDANKIYAGASLNLPQAGTAAQEPPKATAHKDTFAKGGTIAKADQPATGKADHPVAADPHAKQQLNAELQRARLGGVTGDKGAHGAPGAHGAVDPHAAPAGHGEGAHGAGHHDSHTMTNIKDGRTNDVKADGHTTGTHLGDTGHMGLKKTILKKSTEKKADDHGHGAAHHSKGPDVNANATLAAVHTQSKWNSALGDKGQIGHDPTFMDDKTGAAGEVHVLAERHSAGAAIGVDLKKGQIVAGGDASIQLDLIGASGQAQLGSSNTVKGQVYVKGEAHVGANATIGGGVAIDPRKGTVKVGVGGEAFAGAEIKGAAGYHNRYVGAEVEARGQAGIGVAGRAEVGFEKGVFKAKADIGACVGLGGRVTVNLNVNVGAMAADAYNAGSKALSSGWNAVKSWF